MPSYIPLDQCEDRRIYQIRARNFFVGAFCASMGSFIGIRHKLGSDYLFAEYHRDKGQPYGTVHPLRALDVVVPDEILLAERLPTICGTCGSPVRFNDARGADHNYLPEAGWYHEEGVVDHPGAIDPVMPANLALEALLRPLAQAEDDRWKRENKEGE